MIATQIALDAYRILTPSWAHQPLSGSGTDTGTRRGGGNARAITTDAHIVRTDQAYYNVRTTPPGMIMSAIAKANARPINFRVPDEKRILIDTAANVLGKNRTDFILDAVCEKAHEVLADRTQFQLGSEQLAAFNRLLDEPVSEAVVTLLNQRAPWDR
ncbi:MAG: DUF1778 domain-containing protein [Pseudomonadota bacterium]|nr:DUF1778 domain-containing protein [Pseudomonadota bacterium]